MVPRHRRRAAGRRSGNRYVLFRCRALDNLVEGVRRQGREQVLRGELPPKVCVVPVLTVLGNETKLFTVRHWRRSCRSRSVTSPGSLLLPPCGVVVKESASAGSTAPRERTVSRSQTPTSPLALQTVVNSLNVVPELLDRGRLGKPERKRADRSGHAPRSGRTEKRHRLPAAPFRSKNSGRSPRFIRGLASRWNTRP